MQTRVTLQVKDSQKVGRVRSSFRLRQKSCGEGLGPRRLDTMGVESFGSKQDPSDVEESLMEDKKFRAEREMTNGSVCCSFCSLRGVCYDCDNCERWFCVGPPHGHSARPCGITDDQVGNRCWSCQDVPSDEECQETRVTECSCAKRGLCVQQKDAKEKARTICGRVVNDSKNGKSETAVRPAVGWGPRRGPAEEARESVGQNVCGPSRGPG